MANTVVSALGLWPDGTVVAAYTPAAEPFARADIAPAAEVSSVDSQTVSSGALTFTALAAKQPYLIHGVASDSDVSVTTPGDATHDEVDVITLRGVNGKAVTGGTWTITVDTGGGPETTAALKSDASEADVLIALEALSSIGVGDVDVVGEDGGPYTLTFQNALADTAITTTVDVSALTGATERRWIRITGT